LFISGTWDKCAECALQVYVSNSTRERAKELKSELYILCLQCGMTRMKNNDGIKIAPLSDKQKLEIERELFKERKYH